MSLLKKPAIFPSLGEFIFIDKLLDRCKSTEIPQILEIPAGDDCAKLGEWLISTDMSVENVHFNLQWSSITEAIHKALMSNLSDINAMGAKAEFVTLSLCLNKQWTEGQQHELIEALGSLLKEYEICLIGGDTVSATLGCISMTIWGRMPSGANPLRRNTIEPEDYIYVSGLLGASRVGLEQLQRNDLFDEVSLQIHKTPIAPLNLGPWLSKFKKAHAAMDISDGLSQELHHMALSSGVQIIIEETALQMHPSVEKASKRWGIDPLELYLHSGEEYQLLFASALPPTLLVLPSNIQNVHCIGKAVQGKGVQLLLKNNTLLEIEPKAWSHL